MIFLLPQKEIDIETRKNNQGLTKILQDALSTQNFGLQVSDPGSFNRCRLRGDRTLYILAHGKRTQIGDYTDPLSLFNHISSTLNLFDRSNSSPTNRPQKLVFFA